MTITPFLCYAPADGKQLAGWLATELEASEGPIRPWLDETQLTAVDDWADAVAEAIRDCSCVLLILSKDAGKRNSRCTEEWRRALRYKKPLAVLRFVQDAKTPVRLEDRRNFDFTGDRKAALGGLIDWLR